ncbi:hypothetical protein BH09PAT1_BH09PAT1_7490 [soil metagenome]
MHKIFSVISTSDRYEQLCNLIASINKHYSDKGWSIHGVLQGYSDPQIETLKYLCTINNDWKNFDSRLGMFNSRQESMKIISKRYVGDEYTIVCLDDDIEFCAETNFETAIEYAQQSHVGLVSTNWISSEKLLYKKMPQEKYIKQAIVYTGGGLIIKSEIVEMIVKLEGGNFYSDNVETSVRVYVAGYENYRYLGSISIHRACRSGGRKAWVNEGEQKKFSDSRLIDTRRCKNYNKPSITNDAEIHIGDSTDLTLLAKKLHIQNNRLKK